jgi:hypothetical protein
MNKRKCLQRTQWAPTFFPLLKLILYLLTSMFFSPDQEIFSFRNFLLSLVFSLF